MEPSGVRARDVRALQGLRAHNPPPLQDPTVALCLGTYGGPNGAGVSYERVTPVAAREGGGGCQKHLSTRAGGGEVMRRPDRLNMCVAL